MTRLQDQILLDIVDHCRIERTRRPSRNLKTGILRKGVDQPGLTLGQAPELLKCFGSEHLPGLARAMSK
ncbi:hypothetical protein CCR95_09250 [Thiocystis minor]|nr:hypothetical protein [Thiocystis minor]